ncbi:hypothetical protein VTK56DRAFT_646 [Thermocarpiscus australiensis]
MATGPATAGLPAAVAQWSRFFALAELRRLDPDRFASYVPILAAKYPLPPRLIADLLLRPTASNNEQLDPRVPFYLQVLVKQGRIDTEAILRALYKYSTAHIHALSHNDALAGAGDGKSQDGVEKRKPVRWRDSFALEEIILWRLAQGVNQGSAIKTTRDVVNVAKVLARWMALFTEAAGALSRDAFGPIHNLRTKVDMEDSRNAFVLFFFAFVENPVVLSSLRRPACKGICKLLSDSLKGFIPTIMRPDMAQRLELCRTQTLASHVPSDEKDASDINSYMDSLMGLNSLEIPEVPVVNSRAGLYIYLNAALVGRPMINDSALLSYLHNRYQGDIHLTAVQLILASFDVLANAVFRNEVSKTGHLLKSFVINKVPMILVMLGASSPMYSFNPELCITEALGQVDTNVFPTLSGMFEMHNTNSSFHDSVRQDFCFACQLHGLLSQGAISNLLGDITYQSLPDEGRYVKDDLVQSCLQDVDRTQKLIGELDNMNGNVGAAAQAIIEVIGSLCRNKETMTLKQLCSHLAGRPLSLDVLLLFDKPQKILHPLCELLDNWAGYDEDQGEYQPVYEEFGSILLLLLAFVYRYGLSPTDLGIRSPESFVAKLMGGVDLCRPLEELSGREKSHLNSWIHGLFDTEAGGLSDELVSSCPPQDFYLLVPTLFHQIVLALSTGHMADERLKCGLDYLVGVLLLPSLVPALLYLSNQLWAGGPQVQGAIIKILQVLLQEKPSSSEASAMWSSVLNIVAKPLDHALRSYQRQDPKSQEVEPLLMAINENLALSRQTGGADHNELESWSSTPVTNSTNGGAAHAGLAAAVRHTIQNLVQWAQHPPLNGMPPPYTHRQTLVALKMLGARRLLSVLLDELKSLAETGHASVAYDVVTAMICAPDVTTDASLAAAAAAATTAMPDETGAFASAEHHHPPPPAPQQQQPPPPPQRRTTLREALKAEAADWKRIQRRDPLMAETVVRLYRRVEAQTAPPPPDAAATAAAAAAAAAAGMLQPELGALGVGVGGDALGDAIAAAAAAAGEHHHHHHHHHGHHHAGVGVVDAMSLDGAVDLGGLGGTGELAGLGSGAGSAAGGLDLGGDDIFGGLPGTSEFAAEFSSTWDMDLS